MTNLIEAPGSLSPAQVLAALDTADLGIVTADAAGNLTSVSDKFLAFLGRSSEEVLGSEWLRWIAPEVANIHSARWRMAIAREVPFRSHFELVASDDQRQSAEVRVNCVRGGGGEVIGWAGLIYRVSPQIDSSFLDTHPVERFLEGTTDGFVAVDNEFCFTYINRTAAQLIQDPSESLIGRSHWEVFPHLIGTRVEAEYRRAMRDRVQVHFEHQIPVIDTWLELHAYPFADGLSIFFRDISDRKRAEYRLSTALRAAQAGYWDWDLGSDILTWAPESYAILGFAPDVKPTRELFFDRMDNAQREALYCAFVRAIDHTSELNEVVSFSRSDGKRWIEIRGRVIRQAAKPLRVVGLFQDVTERREALERLEHTRNSLTLAMKGGKMGYWSRRLEDDMVEWSPELEEIFGLPVGSFSGGESSFLDHVHREDLPKVVATVQHSIATGADYSVEFRFIHQDGSVRWMDGRGQAMLDETGKATWVYGVGIDITERKLAEQTLRELIDSMPQIAWAVGQDGKVEFLNKTYFEYTGYGMEASGAAGWANVVHPDDRMTSTEYAECVREGRHWEQELRLRRHDGQYRWHLSRLAPLRDLNGVVIRWFGTSTDIHDQKMLHLELESRVEERTRELTEANNEMEGFTYTVSHDLRAPLRAIMATSMILLDEAGAKLTEEERAHLERQAHNAKRLGVLIDELLQLSRVSRQEVRRDWFNLSELAREVLAELTAYGRCEHVTFDIKPDLQACGDAKLVRFVLLNLFDNACKFTPGSGTIQLGSENDTFFVRDEGVGFDPRYATKLFQPFERLVAENEYPGTGIGLANVKRIVERHGGSVWADSTPGAGSTFWFTLPPS